MMDEESMNKWDGYSLPARAHPEGRSSKGSNEQYLRGGISAGRGNLVQDASSVRFVALCQILQRLEDTLITVTEKKTIFREFLKCFDVHCNLYPVLRLLFPQLDRRRPSVNLRISALARAYSDCFALPAATCARLLTYKDPSIIRDGTDACANSISSLNSRRKLSDGSFRSSCVAHSSGAFDARAGDFAACVGAAIYQRLGNRQSSETVGSVNEHLDRIHATVSTREKLHNLKVLASSLGPLENKWLLRVLLKVVKQRGMGESLLQEVASDVRTLLNESADLKVVLDIVAKRTVQVTEHQQSKAGNSTEVHSEANSSMLFAPLRPMLAAPIKVDDLACMFDTDPVTGYAGHQEHPFLVETKYDGERLLAHILKESSSPMDGTSYMQTQVRLFSRKGTDYTARYGGTDCNGKLKKVIDQPLFRGLSDSLYKSFRGRGCILDGEVLAYDADAKKFLPFGSVKMVAAHENISCHLCYIVFDILWYSTTDGSRVSSHSLLSMPLYERKELLRMALRPNSPCIRIAPSKGVATSQEAIECLEEVLRQSGEGIMLKDSLSTYELNKRSGGWYKVKPSFGVIGDSIDLLVIGGFFANTSTRRMQNSTQLIDHCSHFLLGVLDQKAPVDAPRVRSVCRIGTGFSMRELKHLRGLLGPHAVRFDETRVVEKTPWLVGCSLSSATRVDVTWPPSCGVVMEVTGAAFLPSVDFDIQFTLRFPKVLNPIRDDKLWTDSIREDELKALIHRSRSYSSREQDMHSHSEGEEIDEQASQDCDQELESSLSRSTVIPLSELSNHQVVMEEERDIISSAMRTIFMQRGEEANLRQRKYEVSAVATRTSTPTSETRMSTSEIAFEGQSPSYDEGSTGTTASPKPVLSAPRINHFVRKLDKPDSALALRLMPHLRGSDTLGVSERANALKGAGVWVLEGDTVHSKKFLECIVKALGGRVVQSVDSPGIQYVVAPQQNFRTDAIASAAPHILVMTVDWLLECNGSNALVETRRRHILHAPTAVMLQFEEQSDYLGDSFYHDTDERELLRIIQSAGERRKKHRTSQISDYPTTGASLTVSDVKRRLLDRASHNEHYRKILSLWYMQLQISSDTDSVSRQSDSDGDWMSYRTCEGYAEPIGPSATALQTACRCGNVPIYEVPKSLLASLAGARSITQLQEVEKNLRRLRQRCYQAMFEGLGGTVNLVHRNDRSSTFSHSSNSPSSTENELSRDVDRILALSPQNATDAWHIGNALNRTDVSD